MSIGHGVLEAYRYCRPTKWFSRQGQAKNRMQVLTILLMSAFFHGKKNPIIFRMRELAIPINLALSKPNLARFIVYLLQK